MRAAAGALRRPLVAVVGLPPELRRRALIILTACVVLASLYLLWFRDSSLVRVREVSVTGLTTSDTPRLRRALTLSARGMTTLHVDREALERAVAGSAAIRSLEVSADFPGTLHIEVVEYNAAAALVSGRTRVAVAADGSLLREVRAGSALPVVRVPGVLPAKRLGPGAALDAVRIAGAAPPALRTRIGDVRRVRGRGLSARVREGPELIFGTSARLAVKWAAAARIMADPASRGASYIDLRLPERPAAGGLAAETVVPVAPADAAPTPRSPVAASTPADPQTAPTQDPPTAADVAEPPVQSGRPQAPEAVSGAGGGVAANPQP